MASRRPASQGAAVADALKHFFNPALVEQIADRYAAAWSDFPRDRFVRDAAQGLDALELLARGAHIMRALDVALPQDFLRAADIVEASLGQVHPTTESFGMAPFAYLPEVTWVAERGLAHFERAMSLQHALTKRFSCEFSVRPYLHQHTERTLAVFHAWARDPDPHVRRLVSEGTRPRLPWAMRLPKFIADPSPCLPLLEALKDDPEEYVRRSVANHLNDIAKDHPAVTLDVCGRWSEGATAARKKLIAHALRTLVKKGDPAALTILGAGDAGGLDASATLTPTRVKLGESFRVEATVTNGAETSRRVVLDLRVSFPRASGRALEKTFKLATLTLAPGASGAGRTTVSLRDMSTRTHIAGRYEVALLVNGRLVPVGAVDVRG
jgi:3-methyladenine DNA glycosylase AlkC